MKAALQHSRDSFLSFRFTMVPSLKRHTVSMCAWLVFAFSVYADTWHSMVLKYLSSGTFAHGLLVPFISAWLMFRKRDLFNKLNPKYEWTGCAFIFVVSLVWYVASIAHVSIIQQFCFVSILNGLFFTCYGHALTRAFLFPLLYLYFSIPFGSFLTPYLQSLTVESLVALLQMSGIPVFYEGWQIETPRGIFEVASACSGIRYLIASVCIGVLFAYFTFKTLWKRTLFVAFCIVVPVIANILRAYCIIMVAYFTHLHYAVGIDHLIYGWILFGVIVSILFFVGARFAEPVQIGPQAIQRASLSSSWLPHAFYNVVLAFTIGLGPFLLYMADLEPHTVPNHLNVFPDGIGGWEGPHHEAFRWHPKFQGVSFEKIVSYHKDSQEVQVFLAVYHAQTDGKELISDRNVFYDPQVWTLLGKEILAFNHIGIPAVHEINLHGGQENRLIWFWYVIDGVSVTNPVWGKIIEGYALIRHKQVPSYAVALSATYDVDQSVAHNALEEFLVTMAPYMIHKVIKSED